MLGTTEPQEAATQAQVLGFHHTDICPDPFGQPWPRKDRGHDSPFESLYQQWCPFLQSYSMACKG